MNLILKIILIVVFGIILYEVILTYTRFQKRKQIFKMVQKRSQETGKPLLVIGDPENGATNYLMGKSYDCGDVCVDLTGCPNCPNGIKEKVENYLPTLASDSHVVFISCVLEYVSSDQIDSIISQLQRVAGNDLFVVSVEPLSITALLYPTRFITGEGGPNQIILDEYPVKDIRYLRL